MILIMSIYFKNNPVFKNIYLFVPRSIKREIQLHFRSPQHSVLSHNKYSSENMEAGEVQLVLG